jgi:polysaccharide biosynthesis transport protein
VDLRRQFAIVLPWLPLLLATALLAGAAAFVVSNMSQKVYEARATLIVGQSLSAANPDYSQLLVSQRLSATYARVATTRPILESVVKQLGLAATEDDLASSVRADAPDDSTFLTISAQDVDPARAAAIANALAEQLLAASPAIQGRATDVQRFIDTDLKATQAQIEMTQAEVEDLVGLSERTPAQDARLEALGARLATLRSTYTTLLSFSSGNASNLLSVIEPAVAPTSPVSPRPLLNTLLAAILGLFIGAAIIIVVLRLDDSIKTSDDVQAVAGLSTLATIGRMKGDTGRSEIYRLSALLYPRSVSAEAYRTLRTNIEFAAVDAPLRTILVASAAAGEGKTVTASNLAVVFAQAGRRVLLVDADLRKPGIHRVFDLPNSHGLTTLVNSDQVSLEAISYPSEQDNLRILTSGPLPPNPAEVLGSQRMRAIIDRLKDRADLVIFDSPPLHAVTDAAVLSSFLDGTILVIDAGRSHRGMVRQAREGLEKAGAAVFGAVLNRVSGRAHSESGDHYGAYYDSAEAKPERARVAGDSPEGSRQ